MLTLRILDSTKEIEAKVNKAISEHVNSVIAKKTSKLLTECKNLVSGFILSQPEIISLNSSDVQSLRGQLGLPDTQAALATSDIINAVESSVNVYFKKYSANLKSGGIGVNFQPSEFANLLGLSSGHVIYEGGDLHWLSWLLLRGDETIVAGYYYDPTTGLGRSGLGTMKTGGVFRIPGDFSGTQDDNFITRALIGKSQELEISKIFQSILG